MRAGFANAGGADADEPRLLAQLRQVGRTQFPCPQVAETTSDGIWLSSVFSKLTSRRSSER
jgi:hypothetical protein